MTYRPRQKWTTVAVTYSRPLGDQWTATVSRDHGETRWRWTVSDLTGKAIASGDSRLVGSAKQAAEKWIFRRYPNKETES